MATPNELLRCLRELSGVLGTGRSEDEDVFLKTYFVPSSVYTSLTNDKYDPCGRWSWHGQERALHGADRGLSG